MGKIKNSAKVSLLSILHYADHMFLVSSLLDSGAAVNIIDSGLIEKPSMHQTTPRIPPLRVIAINNQPVGEGFLYRQTQPLDLQIRLFHHERTRAPHHVHALQLNAQNPIMQSEYPRNMRTCMRCSIRRGSLIFQSPLDLFHRTVNQSHAT